MADLSDTLNRILDDPDVQAAAQEQDGQSDALPAGGSLLGALPPELISKLPMLMNTLGAIQGKDGGKRDEKTALLLALKPYMSPERCDAIDKLITVCRFGEIFKQLR